MRRIARLLIPTLALFLAAAESAEAVQRGGRAAGAQPRSARRPAATPGTDARTAPGRTAPTRDRTRLGATPDPSDNPFGYPAEEQQRLFFATADGDSSGWISYREAASALRFDAKRFRVYDADNDGRLRLDEYSAFLVAEAAEGRSIRAPRFIRGSETPPARNAEQLRAAYDVDLDGTISRMELDRMINDYDRGATGVTATDVLARLDANGNAVLDVDELDRVASFLAPLVIDPSLAKPAAPGARTVLDLFGAPVDVGENNPPRLIGPVPPFRRLDVDNDGFVDLDDLERLKGRSFARIRLGSVLNTLDIDYDGRLSEGEFLSAMTPKSIGR